MSVDGLRFICLELVKKMILKVSEGLLKTLYLSNINLNKGTIDGLFQITQLLAK